MELKRVSRHISGKEAMLSPTAQRLGITNMPDSVQLDAMKTVAARCFEPLREHFGVPIKVESFFRGPRLNEAIGGARRSQHMKGQAIDIDDDYGKVTNAEMFFWLANNVEFDQLIWEFGTGENPGWIHISYNRDFNRNKLTVAHKKTGRTQYQHFDNLDNLKLFLKEL